MSEIREAAKRLCRWVDENGLKPLPHPGGVLEIRKGGQSQRICLKRVEGEWHWFWMWEPFRTQDAWEYEQGLPIGRERDMARRLLSVLEIAEAGEKTS